MYLKKVSLTNIKSIQELDINFKDNYAGWHVLLGDNGTGKSTIIKAISLGLIGVPDAYALQENWNNWINKDKATGQIELTISHPNLSQKLKEKGDWKHSLSFYREKNKNNGKNGHTKTRVEFKAEPYQDLSILMGPFSAAYGPFRRFEGNNNEIKDLENISYKLSAHITAFKPELALSDSIEWLKELQFKNLERLEEGKLIDALKSFINNSQLLPEEAVLSKVNSTGVFFKDANGIEVSIEELSDGYRSILSLVLELIRQFTIQNLSSEILPQLINDKKITMQGIVMIDEIDIHLHPNWQVRIGEWFTTYFPNIQFIVTTHSPLICRAAKNGTIWKLELADSKLSSRQIVNEEYDRLVYGNILEAMGTELFGENNARSKESSEKLDKLARLNMLHTLGKTTEQEEKELIKLRKTFTTDDQFEF